MKIDLTNKNILVTGASRGIGAGISRALAEAGAKIAVQYNSNETTAKELAHELGSGSKTFKTNLKNSAECEQLFNEVVNQFGHVDAIVNNAGIAISSPFTNENWTNEWDETLAVNLRAVAILCKKAIEHFKTRTAGRIINISSRSAYRGEGEEYLAYAAAKTGVVTLSKSIAKTYGKDGITSFVIAPGWVKTDMTQAYIDEIGEASIIKDLSLNRITEPKDIAPIVTLLASGLADHATGTTIDINAGSYVH